MRLILPILLALVLSASARDRYWPPETVSEAPYIQRYMERVILPVLDLQDATFLEAVTFLHRRVTDLEYQREFPLEIIAPSGPSIPGLGSPPDPPNDFRETRITVRLTNIPIYEAFRYVTSSAGAKFVLHDEKIIIAEAGYSLEFLKTRRIPLPQEIFGRTATPEDYGADSPTIESLWKDPREFLVSRGVLFGSKGGCSLEEEPPVLVATCTEDQFDPIDQVLAGLLPKPVSWPADSKIVAGDDGSAKQQTTSLAAGMILPKVDLRNISLADAVEQLNQLVLETPSTNAPGGSLLAISVSEEDSVRPGKGIVPLPERHVFYTAQGVSLLNAARALAAQVRGMLAVEEGQLIFRLKDGPSSRRPVARVYLIPPGDWFRSHAAAQKSSGDSPAPVSSAETETSSANISLPSPYDWLNSAQSGEDEIRQYLGDTFHFLAAPEAHQDIEVKVNALWKDYYASEDWARIEPIHRRLRALFPE